MDRRTLLLSGLAAGSLHLLSGSAYAQNAKPKARVSLVLEGDSRSVIYSSTPDLQRVFQQSYHAQAGMRYRHAFDVISNTAVAGDGVDEILNRWSTTLAIARTAPETSVAALSLFAGVNSFGSQSAEEVFSAIRSMADEASANNIVPFLALDPGSTNPKQFSEKAVDRLLEYNQMLRDYVSESSGDVSPRLADFPRVMWQNDPAQDGFIEWKPGYAREDGRGVHFSTLACYHLAEEFYNSCILDVVTPVPFEFQGVNLIQGSDYRDTLLTDGKIAGGPFDFSSSPKTVTSNVSKLSKNWLVIEAEAALGDGEFAGWVLQQNGDHLISDLGEGDDIDLVVDIILERGARDVYAVEVRLVIQYVDGVKTIDGGARKINYEGHYGSEVGPLYAAGDNHMQLRCPRAKIEGRLISLTPMVMLFFGPHGGAARCQIGEFKLGKA